jgi:hypothetical protein
MFSIPDFQGLNSLGTVMQATDIKLLCFSFDACFVSSDVCLNTNMILDLEL